MQYDSDYQRKQATLQNEIKKTQIKHIQMETMPALYLHIVFLFFYILQKHHIQMCTCTFLWLTQVLLVYWPTFSTVWSGRLTGAERTSIVTETVRLAM